MKASTILSTEQLAQVFAIPRCTEQSLEQGTRAAQSGVFIGCAEHSNIPFFFSPELAVNPHVLIAGMSGGGKTYLTRNLALKLYAVLGHMVVIIDFTGEYREFAESAGCLNCELDGMKEALTGDAPMLLYANLAHLKNEEKIVKGTKLMRALMAHMRARSIQGGMRLSIVLDEAWKLLAADTALNTIIREGRKYGTGLVLASQIVEDVEQGILANIATLFAFRMQNRASLARMAQNYRLDEQQVGRMQRLGVGGCCIIQTYKSGERVALVVGRVQGLAIAKPVMVKTGETMVEVEYARLERMVRHVAQADATELLASINANKSVELGGFIAALCRLGANRLTILGEVRNLGVPDAEIADAFAQAIGTVISDGA